MLSTIYLLQFNNYYNRQVKKYDSLSPYLSFLCEGVLNQNPIPNVNFIPNDGIQAKQVINWDGGNPDYLLVVDNNEIISRWFVIESVRTLKGQFELTLYRDTIADYYDQILNATMFIEKGYLNRNDPGIFNKEDMTFNQIKTKEDLLKDGTKCAWIVGYCNDNSAIPDNKITFGGIPIPDEILGELDDWLYKDYVDTEHKIIDMSSVNNGFAVKYAYAAGGIKLYKVLFNARNNEGVISRNATIDDNVIINDIGLSFDYLDQENYLGSIKGTEELTRLTKNQLDSQDIALGNITRLNNRILKVGTGEGTIYYRVKVNVKNDTIIKVLPAGSNAYKAQLEIANDIYITNPNAINYKDKFFLGLNNPKQSIFCEYEENTVSITLETITGKTGFEMTNFPETRPTLIDAPYSMFCIPYGDYTYKIGNQEILVNKENSISLAMGIATALGGTGTSNLYDLQLLPYCPIPLLRSEGPSIDLQDSSISNALSEFVYHLESRTILFFAKESTGSFDITYNFYTYQDAIDLKVDSQTKFWRLCSPNYNGVFEFNPYMNKGTSIINVDYTYKPHQPYIHLNPNFRNLYGSDFNDARGLICGGDYSLPIIDDAWTDYQISNKNFNEIFNRQIQNLEVQHDIARTQDLVNAIVGTVSGGTTGAGAGAMIGGGWGAAIGGVVGTAASGVAGGFDVHFNEVLRNEAINYAKDNFGYQLDNIKALPDALTKISSFNANNKIFPFIELYSATEEERKALKNKIIYNGMSIGRIGTINEYLVNKPVSEFAYFKGQIIKIDINDDYHVANKIASELYKGVYL